MNITLKQVVKYTALPGIIPRLKDFRLNFPYIAYLMALVFTATRMLPNWHPYVRVENMGRYGIGDVLRVAGQNLKGGWKNIDQYIVYISFILGILLLLAQFLILLSVIVTHSAEAAVGISNFTGMFNTPVRTNDIALMMLDKTFQIPGIYGSKFMPQSAADVTAFSSGLQVLFSFYNYGILFIAGLIVLYFIFAVIVETVQTGNPFGERFQEVYVPIRLMIALALLVPTSYGLSAGQHLVLRVADWGSGFATNGWIIFNQRAQLNPLGMGSEQLLVAPRTQPVDDLLRFHALAHSCRAAYKFQYGKTIDAYLIYPSGGTTASVPAYGSDFNAARTHFPNSDVKITFGEKSAAFTSLPGQVKPYCGQINIPVSDKSNQGALLIQQAYWSLLQRMWQQPSDLASYGDRTAATELSKGDPSKYKATNWPTATSAPGASYFANVHEQYQPQFNNEIQQVAAKIRSLPESNLKMDASTLNLGWGGAGLWFNRIAEYNGAIVTANTLMPTPSAYPRVMGVLTRGKASTNQGGSLLTRFLPSFTSGVPLKDILSGGKLDDPAKDSEIASYLDKNYSELTKDSAFAGGTKRRSSTTFGAMLNLIFDMDALYDLRNNTQIHPFARMSALGRSIIDRSMTYLGATLIVGGLSGIGSSIDAMLGDQNGHFGNAFDQIGGLLTPLIIIGLMSGIILYYIIPLMPFMYFFLAVGRWVKGIFEALVCVPLWALAHLRIDGDGVPGPAAANGYYILLEIFLRPILTLFGLMAAVSCFTAMAVMLDMLFDLSLNNLAGHTADSAAVSFSAGNQTFRRSEVDDLFYTIMYAAILYLTATSSFKLIDLIPKSIMRYLGSQAQVQSFNDQSGDPSQLADMVSRADYFLGDDLANAGRSLGKAVGRGAAQPAEIIKDLKEMMPPPQQPGGPQ